MKKISLQPLAVLLSALLLTACATPPVPTTPTGANKVQANSDEAIRDYAKRAFENDKLAAEKAQLQIYTNALLRQTEELKAYITSQIVDAEMNRSKGIQSSPTAAQTPKLDEALTAINNRMASLERSISSVQQIAAKSVNMEDLMMLRKKLASIELKFPADKAPPLSNETFDAKEVIVQSTRNAAAVAAGLDFVKKQQLTTPPTSALITEAGYYATPSDVSLIGLLSRWANIAGLSTQLNGAPIDLAIFPKHAALYNDFVILENVRLLKPTKDFMEALSSLSQLYAKENMSKFNLRVLNDAKVLSITSTSTTSESQK